jgi:hypothetical protein
VNVFWFVAGLFTFFVVEWVSFKLLHLHICDEPRDHPPRAFEVENPDAEAAEDAADAGFA